MKIAQIWGLYWLNWRYERINFVKIYLLNKKQQKTDRKIGVFCRSPSHRGVNWNGSCKRLRWLSPEAPPTGAWIEIQYNLSKERHTLGSPSHRGVNWNGFVTVIPLISMLEAPPTGAWIEIKRMEWTQSVRLKPLPQGRELKYTISAKYDHECRSPSHRGVNWNTAYVAAAFADAAKPLPQGRELK